MIEGGEKDVKISHNYYLFFYMLTDDFSGKNSIRT